MILVSRKARFFTTLSNKSDASIRLSQVLVIAGKCHHENHRIDALTSLDPFPTFEPLVTHVVDLEINLVNDVAFHGYLCGADTAHEDILLGQSVVEGGNSGEVLEVVFV